MLLQQPSPGKPVSEMGTVLSALLKKHGSLPNGPLLLLLSCFSCVRLCDPIDGSPPGFPVPWDSPGKNTGVACHFLLQCMKGKVKGNSLSRVRLLATPWTAAHQAPQSMGFSRQEYYHPLITICRFYI